MIQSMTGYGASTKSSASYKVTVEMKSLNHKYFDLAFKLPRAYLKYEHELRSSLTHKLRRGKVVVFLDVELLSSEKSTLSLNRALAKSYLKELSAFKNELYMTDEVSLSLLLSLPDVIPTEKLEEDPEEWQLIQAATEEACQHLMQSRKNEGKALAEDLAAQQINIAEKLAEVEAVAPTRIDIVRDRIQKSLDEVKDMVDVDNNRFEQELIFYLEKLDINEEIVRLKQHLAYFDTMLKKDQSNGKKLNFIAQEMGREINTIGSKANDANMQQFVISMKDSLERIKEQVQNIL